MAVAVTHQPTEPARERATRALLSARRRGAGRAGAPSGGSALLALQRRAGNAAVSALLAGKARSEGGAAERMDAALHQLRSDDPSIDVVETGLKEAKAAGVPVDLDGTPPPPSALAVTKTGFGPAEVAPKEPQRPPKPVPKVTALGKASAKGAKGPPGTGGGGGGGGPAGKTPPALAGPAGPVATAGSAVATGAGLAPDQLWQPPVPPVGTGPEQDPAFGAVTGGVVGAGATAKAHGHAAAKAKEAQGAAVPPAGDLQAQAEAAKTDSMDAQQPGSFDKKAFIAAVKAAIEEKSPKTLEEADEYRESGKAGEIKGEVSGLVTEGTGEQAKDIVTATDAAPDQSKAVPKKVVPMRGEPAGAAVPVPAVGAAPKPAPPEQTNLQGGKHQADAELADADITEEQLTRSNEPEFQQAVEDKKAAAEHADTAPAQFRQQEEQVIGQDRAAATAGASAAVDGMQGTRVAALAGLVADKAKTKERDEGKRGEVTAKIQAIYGAAEGDVKAILGGIDAKVEQQFDTGEAGARAAFETYVEAKMSAYKQDRYGGWLGGLKWAKDKLLGMPSKVNEFYEAGRELYLKRMDGVISRVADIVGSDLTRAKKRIATGKAQITAYVKSLPAGLRKVGSTASQEIGDRFESLEGEVAAKQEATVDALASKYVESRKGLDERIEALQAENQGLVDKAIGAIKGVINTIRELAAMLKNVLSRAAGVVGDIIKDPVGFLGNLISGVKGGILKFKDNILEHLRKGLMSWLFGALAEGGVELPDTFDIKGVVKLLASLFGLTWATIRGRIVRRIGARAMAAAEKGVEVFQVLATQGVGGLWQMLVDKLGDIKEMILAKIKDFVITKIITAGIMWIIGLLNPAAAFIKACKLIYDIVMFFVRNASRIARFVNTVIDSVADIARGNVSGVVDKINNVLGQTVGLLITALASLIGLGGIGQKIRRIVTALRRPFIRAVDFVVDKGMKLAGPLIRGLANFGRRVRDRATRRREPAQEAAPESVRGRARAAARGRLARAHGVSEAEGAVDAVRRELGPAGLKALRLGPPEQDGSRRVLAKASPWKSILKIIPWAAGLVRGAQVAAHIRVEYQEPPDVSQLNFGKRAVRKDGRIVLDEHGQPVMEAGDVAAVGGAFVGRPRAGERALSILAVSGRAVRHHNRSHAEFHSAAVLGVGGPVSGKVQRVTVLMKGASPCPACASSLIAAAEHILSRSPEAEFVLDCSGVKLYRPDRPGNFKTWDDLVKAMHGWTVHHPPAPREGFKVSSL